MRYILILSRKPTGGTVALGSAADVADLAQDTCVQLLQKTERVELKAPRAFLRTIARGLVIDHWRHEEIERAYLESIAHLPQALAHSAEARALVLEFLEDITRLTGWQCWTSDLATGTSKRHSVQFCSLAGKFTAARVPSY